MPASMPVSAPAASPNQPYPRYDGERRSRLAALARDLDAHWQAQRTKPGHPLALLETLRNDAPDAIFDAMEPHLGDPRWTGAMLDDALAVMRADPFAAPPLRVFQGGAMIGAVLAEVGRISLSVIVRRWEGVVSAVAAPGVTAADAVMFSPGHSMTAFVASGGATITRYAADLTDAERAGVFIAAQARPCRCLGSAPVAPGSIVRTDQTHQSYNLTGGSGDTVMIQLFVGGPSAVPMREYDAATGALRRLSAPNRTNSFRQMTLALLRTMGRRDAAPQFAAALAEPDFSLRWQVMREFVALDPVAALPHLTAMAADDPHPEVRRAAHAATDIVETALAAARVEQEA